MMHPVSKKRLAANSLSGIGTMILNILFVFWLYQYLLARLPAENFAIYPVLMSIMMLVPVLTSFFASALSREVIMAYSAGRMRDVSILHSSTVLALGGFLTLTALAGGIAALTIERLINVPVAMLGEVRLMTFIVTLELCVALFGVPFSTAFEVRQKFAERDAITVVSGLFRIAFTIVLLMVLGPRVLWVTVASLAATALTVGGVIFFSRRLLAEFRVALADFRGGVVRSLLSFGVWTSLGTFSVLIYQSAAPVILNILSGPVQVTSYFIGSLFDRRISSLMSVALAPIQPLMISMSATGNFDRLGFVYLRGGCYALWFAMALAAPIIVFAPEFIALYLGPGYEDTVVVIRVLLLVLPPSYAAVMLSRVAIATGRVRLFFGGAIVTSLITLAGMIVALNLSESGAIAAALVQALVNLLTTVFFFWPLGLWLTGVRLGRFLRQTLLRGMIPSLGGLLVWLPLKLLGAGEGWAGLILASVAGGIAYLAAAWLFCLEPDEKQALSQGLGRALGRRP